MPPKSRLQLDFFKTNEEAETIIHHIAQHIKKAREREGLSQRELSKKLGRGTSQISRIENEELLPTILDLIAISQILNEPLDLFLPHKYRDKNQPKSTEVSRAFDRIQNEEKEKIAIELIESLAKPK